MKKERMKYLFMLLLISLFGFLGCTGILLSGDLDDKATDLGWAIRQSPITGKCYEIMNQVLAVRSGMVLINPRGYGFAFAGMAEADCKYLGAPDHNGKKIDVTVWPWSDTEELFEETP